jgi:hypothetical protein
VQHRRALQQVRPGCKDREILNIGSDSSECIWNGVTPLNDTGLNRAVFFFRQVFTRTRQNTCVLF